MSQYDIPQKIINIVKAMYDGFKCAVVEEGNLRMVRANDWCQTGMYNVWLSFSAYYRLGNEAYC